MLDLLAQHVRRLLAPHLKQLIAPWLRCRFDVQQDVRRAALAAFQSAFPAEGKYAQALAFCRDVIVRSIAEIVFALPSAGEEEDGISTCRVSTSLLTAAHIVVEAAGAGAGGACAGGAGAAGGSSADLDALGALLLEHLFVEKLWKLSDGSQKATVRSALHGLLLAVLQHLPSLVNKCTQPLATTLLDGISQREPAVHASLSRGCRTR